MNNDRDNNNRSNEDKNLNRNMNPEHKNRAEVNHESRSWEPSRNPTSDNDRKGRNVDIDRENQKNEIKGREQQTSPNSSTTDQLIDRFNRKDEDRNKNNS